MKKIGIDIGGTFIDLMLTDGDTSLTLKVPSTLDNPSAAAIRALQQVQAQYGVDRRSRRDVAAGLLSPAAAARDYGVTAHE